jgi:hypothetical protein
MGGRRLGINWPQLSYNPHIPERMNNDSLWRDRVVIEKMKGRDVRCFSVKESSSLKASIKYYSKQTKNKFSKDGVIWLA